MARRSSYESFFLHLVVAGSLAGSFSIMGTGQAQDSPKMAKSHLEDSESPVQVLTHEVILEQRMSPDRMAAMLYLGRLEAGKNYQIELRVHNPTNNELPFTGVGSTCGCVRFASDRETVPALGSVNIVFQIHTPARSKDVNVATAVRFVEQATNREAFNLGVRYELYNMFKILGNQWTIELSDRDSQPVQTSRMPILIATPMKHDDLEIELTKNLRDLAARIVQADGQYFIEVTANRKNIVNSSISGELIVRRKGTEDADGINLVIKLQPVISLNPVSVRLVPSQAGNFYQAKAILRIRKPPIVESNTKKEEQDLSSAADPIVELLIDGQKAEVDCKKLGESGIYSLTVRYTGPKPRDHDGPISAKWAVRSGEESAVIESTAYFQE